MEKNRKKARAWLKSSTLTEYNFIITEAKLTPKEQDTLNKIILQDYSQQKLALENHEDVSCIKRSLRHIYDKVYSVLLKQLL